MRNRTVLCIGEALFDLTESKAAGQVGPVYLPHPGGSSFNVAVGAARLGMDATFAGSFADDLLGERLRVYLRDEGVTVVGPVDSRTLTAVSIMSLDNAEPRYSFYANPASYGSLLPRHLLVEQLKQADVIHAGSISLIEPNTRAAVLHAFRTGLGLKTLDPNARPDLIPDRTKYLREFEELVELADLIKISSEDAAYLYPDLNHQGVANALLALGCSVVVITAAADGAQLWTTDNFVAVPISNGMEVVDTTGGGDSVMAALITQLAAVGTDLDNDQWGEVLKFAMDVAAITCSRPGGADAMPSTWELSGAVSRTIHHVLNGE